MLRLPEWMPQAVAMIEAWMNPFYEHHYYYWFGHHQIHKTSVRVDTTILPDDFFTLSNSMVLYGRLRKCRSVS
jgi:hypothetical protein